MSDEDFLKRVYPWIELAALAAKRRASRVIADTHLLWTVYLGERNKLILEAAELEESERVAFEERLLQLAGESEETVWVPEENI